MLHITCVKAIGRNRIYCLEGVSVCSINECIRIVRTISCVGCRTCRKVLVTGCTLKVGHITCVKTVRRFRIYCLEGVSKSGAVGLTADRTSRLCGTGSSRTLSMSAIIICSSYSKLTRAKSECICSALGNFQINVATRST